MKDIFIAKTQGSLQIQRPHRKDKQLKLIETGPLPLTLWYRILMSVANTFSPILRHFEHSGQRGDNHRLAASLLYDYNQLSSAGIHDSLYFTSCSEILPEIIANPKPFPDINPSLGNNHLLIFCPSYWKIYRIYFTKQTVNKRKTPLQHYQSRR